MEDPNRPDVNSEDFLPAGLASLGIEADEVEMAVIGAAHAMFWPPIRELFELDTGDAAPEPGADLSRAPVDR
jgi:hypothetical protein